MENNSGTVWHSPTALANHLSCAHLSHLNRMEVAGKLKPIFRANPTLELLVELGERHEANYLASMVQSGKSVEDLSVEKFPSHSNSTIASMGKSPDIIYQPWLVASPWRGRADFLIKSSRPSKLGDWSYEVADTKLALNTKGTTVLQLCLYSEILGELQGVIPEFMYIVKPGSPFEIETLRVDDYMAYFRMAKKRYSEFFAQPQESESYPDPCSHCAICKWAMHCETTWRKDDHISYIAGIRKSQRKELNEQGVDRLEAFAQSVEPLKDRPRRGSVESFQRIHAQAKIQYKGRVSGNPEFEFQPNEPERGLNLLPEPNQGDVFFDIEGIPRASAQGLEYLFGYVEVLGNQPKYHGLWALSKFEERKLFEGFIEMLTNRLKQYPGMHIYHYAPYEPSALKRLAMHHGICEEELDFLLRSERFIDLYSVVRQSIRASVESYSIKQMERFCGYTRSEPLENARVALANVERLIELRMVSELNDQFRLCVERYNEDDCQSTLKLRDWLEVLRELRSKEVEIQRPPIKEGDPSEKSAAVSAENKIVFDQLIADIADSPEGAEQQARWLLAHMLDYFRRESKCSWWEFHRMRELTPDEMFFEKAALAGLELVEEIPPTGRGKLPTHRYKFPEQEFSLSAGDRLWNNQGETVGSVTDIDAKTLCVEIKRTEATMHEQPTLVFAFDTVLPGPIPEALRQFGRLTIAAMESKTAPRSARYDLLTRNTPRLKTLALPLPGEITDVATAIALDMDDSYLAIQGPPGAGKTYVGSRMIRDLARAGKRIGVTALSHKVILNILDGVSSAATDGAAVRVAHQGKESGDFPDSVKLSKDKTESLSLLNQGFVVGGTAWLWSDPTMENQLDYLFIDEAGQMSLAIALAVGRSAKNIILLGDPQQLEQPQLGSHPEGAGVAALGHILGQNATIPPEMGLFLDRTWRLPPEICRFTSEQYYESRLQSQPGLEKRMICGTERWSGSGLRFLHVDHTGCENRSDEEVFAIVQLFEELHSGKYRWRDKDSVELQLTVEDILVVAPFNVQVQALKDALPDSARVGTVDKFQGQEAPVVIYSMTSSSIEDAPRGITFLFSRNRMNVATSRAKCIAIVVASPALLAPSCSSPEAIRLANGLCRFVELSNSL